MAKRFNVDISYYNCDVTPDASSSIRCDAASFEILKAWLINKVIDDVLKESLDLSNITPAALEKLLDEASNQADIELDEVYDLISRSITFALKEKGALRE